MGQKVHPYILRIGFGKNWRSRWFVDRKKDYAQFLEEDVKIREMIKNNYPLGSIAEIIIERVSTSLIRIKIRTSRPGIIIGRRGEDIEQLKSKIADFTRKEVIVDVEEVSDPALEAQLVAETIAFQIIKRVNFRKAMKRAIQQAQNLGCEGVRIKCSGRLAGAEIARSEGYKYGKVPLHTFRADIDYGYAIAKTTYGTIGVKVWIYKGEKALGSYLVRREVEKDKFTEEQ
ncbi:MAG: 30S ribosomal protein S3 [Candidatus Omnitrophica bacterium]|nr:30S ribosomal protein S3 [Candidatus Omnitrophota bacterium]